MADNTDAPAFKETANDTQRTSKAPRDVMTMTIPELMRLLKEKEEEAVRLKAIEKQFLETRDILRQNLTFWGTPSAKGW